MNQIDELTSGVLYPFATTVMQSLMPVPSTLTMTVKP